ncbi:MAG: SulP family inorganic anion transporter [Bradymonadia bacterium]
MKKMFFEFHQPGFKLAPARELMASVVVFLVALPLCMGIAGASGVPESLGLITGIVGGLVVGFITGSPLQVSGPAAGLAVLVLEFVTTHGVPMLGVAVFSAGAMQFIAGWLKLGRWFRATSPAVIQGMLAGIGVLIFASQFHFMVDDAPRKTGIDNLLSIPEAIQKGVIPIEGSSHHIAAAIGMLTLVTLVLWNTFRPKALKALPGALIAVVAASLAAHFFQLESINYVEIPANFVESLNFPNPADFVMLLDHDFFLTVVGIAVIASAETLLCASAVDQMHEGARTNYDRELAAQGVGNLICGVFGALPMTGVIVRSSANVDAGAQTRISAVAHGLWLLILVVALPFVLEAIPRASLGAILVYTGYKLMNPKAALKLWRFSKGEMAIYAVTVALIVASDLLTGVLVGIALAAAKLLLKFSRLDVKQSQTGNRVDLHLHGAATFVALPTLAEALEALPRGTEVHVHAGSLAYIDHACLELLASAQRQQESTGGSFAVEWDDLESRYREQLVLTPAPIPNRKTDLEKL